MKEIRELEKKYMDSRDTAVALFRALVEELEAQRQGSEQIRMDANIAAQEAMQAYQMVQERARQYLTQDEWPGENVPLQDLIHAVEKSRHAANVQALRSLLSVRVHAGKQRYAAALTRQQDAARDMLCAYEAGNGLPEAAHVIATFMDAVALGAALNSDTDGTEEMLCALEAAGLPVRLLMGLVAGAYVAEGCAMPVQADAPIGTEGTGKAPQQDEGVQVAVRHCCNVPRLSEFKSHMALHPEDANTLVRIANAMLYDPETENDAVRRAAMMQHEWYLYHQGYVDHICLTENGVTKVYFCLTRAGCELLQNREAVQFLKAKKNPIVHYVIKPQGYVSTQQIKGKGARRILDMLLWAEQEPKLFMPVYEHLLLPGQEWEAAKMSGEVLTCISGEQSQEDIDWLRSAVENIAGAGGRVTILAEDHAALEKLQASLDLAAVAAQVRFGAMTAPGVPVEMTGWQEGEQPVQEETSAQEDLSDIAAPDPDEEIEMPEEPFVDAEVLPVREELPVAAEAPAEPEEAASTDAADMEPEAEIAEPETPAEPVLDSPVAESVPEAEPAEPTETVAEPEATAAEADAMTAEPEKVEQTKPAEKAEKKDDAKKASPKAFYAWRPVEMPDTFAAFMAQEAAEAEKAARKQQEKKPAKKEQVAQKAAAPAEMVSEEATTAAVVVAVAAEEVAEEVPAVAAEETVEEVPAVAAEEVAEEVPAVAAEEAAEEVPAVAAEEAGADVPTAPAEAEKPSNVDWPEITDEPEARCLNGAEEECARYVALACKAYANGRNDVGSAMLRSLAVTHENVASVWQRWACADNDPAWERMRMASTLQEIYPNAGAAVSPLAVAAYLRMYCSEDAQVERWVRSAKTVEEHIRAMPGTYQTLYEAFLLLDELLMKHSQSITPAVFHAMGSSQAGLAKLDELKGEARAILTSNMTKISFGRARIADLYKRLLGNESEIHFGLEAVAENDLALAADVAALMKGLHPKLLEEGDAIEQLIDKAYDATEEKKGRNKNDTIYGDARSNLSFRLRRCIKPIREWLGQVEAMKNEAVAPTQKAVADKLRVLLPTALEEVQAGMQLASGDCKAAMTVLENTLKTISRALCGEGADFARDDYYLCLAGENVITIAEDGQPRILQTRELVEPYEMCRRLANLVEAPRIDAQEAAEAFRKEMEARSASLDFCANYGNARHLLEAAHLPADVLDDQMRGEAQAHLREAKNKFQGLLEMADARGWFEHAAEKKQVVENATLIQCALYEAEENYALVLRCMQDAMEYIRNQASQEWEEPLRARLLEAMRRHRQNESNATASRIMRLIEQGNYTAADSAIKKASQNGFVQEEAEETVSQVFTDFVHEGTYGYYYNHTDNRKPMTQVFESSNVRRRERDTGHTFLENWPDQPSRMIRVAEGLLRGMNQRVDKVTRMEGVQDGSHVHVTFQPGIPTTDYEHPFAAFGTRMLEKGIDMVCLPLTNDTSRNSDINGYFEHFRRGLVRTSAQAVIFIINDALPLSARRQLASKIWHEMNDRKPFIFIDRVLALFLAEKIQAQRWNVLLQCALPFAMVQPYIMGSAALTPPEMFVGRRDELGKIAAFASDDSANIVYGGRQLGKSALLYRVAQLHHVPEKQSYAVVVNIKKKAAEAAVAEIVEKLTLVGFPGMETLSPVTPWGEMVRHLREVLRTRPEVKLRLMLDEADCLLENDGLVGYDAIDALRMAQDMYPERFKFVLAGVHNVLRFYDNAYKGNSLLPHLQSVCVRPLDYKDAEQLLERPLRYLGFTFDGSDEQQELVSMILTTTNYYPGLIHHYAYKLVASIGEGRTVTVPRKPPYELDEKFIMRQLTDRNFQQAAKEKFLMTIDVEEGEHYYHVLAYLMAYMCYDTQEARQKGVTIDEIIDVVTQENIPLIRDMSRGKLKALLDELCQLNIFREENERYRFERLAFLNMLGTWDEIVDDLDQYIGKEVRA